MGGGVPDIVCEIDVTGLDRTVGEGVKRFGCCGFIGPSGMVLDMTWFGW